MYRSIQSRIQTVWAGLKLSARFALVSFFVLLTSAFVIGSWITQEIEDGVVKNTAFTTAVYIETFVAPYAQELSEQDRLSGESVAALEKLLDPMNAEQRVFSIKLWKPDGVVAYSSEQSIIGDKYPITPILASALDGKVAAEFDELHDAENALERVTGIPMLEVYSPIRKASDGTTFAVAEFYVSATQLEDELLQVKLETWGVVGATTLFVYALLFGTVHGGSKTIDRQRRSLSNRVDQLSALQGQLKSASLRSSEINERLLRRIGSELHDGPAQLIGLAMLRLDALQPTPTDDDGTDADQKGAAFTVIEHSLGDALAEIRGISSGLVLPELANMTTSEVVSKATETHERRTGMKVSTIISGLPETVSLSVKLCAYRFIQETLSNAFRHAEVDEAVVQAQTVSDAMTISVTDTGIGFDGNRIDGTGDHLGLIGLRDRIESIGGEFEMRSESGRGTRVTATFSIGQELAATTETSIDREKSQSGKKPKLRSQIS